jgi:hypothetical protein
LTLVLIGATRDESGNVPDKLPKAVQARAKDDLHQVWMAETRAAAEAAFDLFLEKYGARDPKAAECLAKDRTELLAFYDLRLPGRGDTTGQRAQAAGMPPSRWSTSSPRTPSATGASSMGTSSSRRYLPADASSTV